MVNREVKQYFDRYVFGLMKNDIQREINLARAGDTGGGFLAALGLLCYTEFMGKLLLKGKGSYTKQFKAFFCTLGEDYEQLIQEKEIDVYQLFRCGLAGTCFAGDCDIELLNTDYPAGIIVKPDGKAVFVVEKYFDDFMSACDNLYNEMLADAELYLPDM